MMKVLSERLVYLMGFITIALMLGGAFYIEKFDGIMPCPLCVLQRIDLALLGLLCFVGASTSFNKFGRLFLSSFSLCIALIGVFLSGRQVWLQHLPVDKNADCGVSLHYLMSVLPLNEVVRKVFQGTAECSQTGWAFLNVSLAEWTLVGFVGFTVLMMWLVWRAVNNRSN